MLELNYSAQINVNACQTLTTIHLKRYTIEMFMLMVLMVLWLRQHSETLCDTEIMVRFEPPTVYLEKENNIDKFIMLVKDTSHFLRVARSDLWC